MKTTGGTAISNEAGLVFELRDAKKKVEGKATISIQDFFKGKRNFDAEKVDLKLTFDDLMSIEGEMAYSELKILDRTGVSNHGN